MTINNVARIYSADVLNNIYYVVMEYINGETLNEYLNRGAPFYTRVSILQTIIEIMRKAYEEDKYHGDLHNRNIIIREDEPFIIDFGTNLFSGAEYSRKRDSKLLLKLSKEIVPEMEQLLYLGDYLYEVDSKAVSDLIYISNQLTWKIECIMTGKKIDKYGYKALMLMKDIIQDMCPFVNEEYLKKTFINIDEKIVPCIE